MERSKEIQKAYIEGIRNEEAKSEILEYFEKEKYLNYRELYLENNLEKLKDDKITDKRDETICLSDSNKLVLKNKYKGKQKCLKEKVKQIYDTDIFYCAYCRRQFDYENLTLDHVLPKEKIPCFAIFSHNLVFCCDNCNRSMNDTLNEEKLKYHDHFHKINIEYNFEINTEGEELIISPHDVDITEINNKVFDIDMLKKRLNEYRKEGSRFKAIHQELRDKYKQCETKEEYCEYLNNKKEFDSDYTFNHLYRSLIDQLLERFEIT